MRKVLVTLYENNTEAHSFSNCPRDAWVKVEEFLRKHGQTASVDWGKAQFKKSNCPAVSWNSYGRDLAWEVRKV